jgi:hypothetical protein
MAITYERVRKGAGDIMPVVMDLGVGATGATIGMFASKWAGEMLENYVKPNPVSGTDKMIAMLINATPKVLGAVLLAKYVPEMKDGMMKTAGTGVTLGTATSVVVDVVERFQNSWLPKNYMLGNQVAEQRIQALLQENSALKQNIQRLSDTQTQVTGQVSNVTVSPIRRVEGPPNRPLEKKYQFTPGMEASVPGVQYEKRPLEKKHQFVGDVTTPSVLATGFGFHV